MYKEEKMYKVFGYDDMCCDFYYGFNSFVKAVKAYKELIMFNIVFISRDKPGTCLFVSERL